MERKIILSMLSILMLLILVSCHADAGQRASYKNNNITVSVKRCGSENYTLNKESDWKI